MQLRKQRVQAIVAKTHEYLIVVALSTKPDSGNAIAIFITNAPVVYGTKDGTR